LRGQPSSHGLLAFMVLPMGCQLCAVTWLPLTRGVVLVARQLR